MLHEHTSPKTYKPEPGLLVDGIDAAIRDVVMIDVAVDVDNTVVVPVDNDGAVLVADGRLRDVEAVVAGVPE